MSRSIPRRSGCWVAAGVLRQSGGARPAFVLSYWAQQGAIGWRGCALVDGSGYSRDNRLSAALLVGSCSAARATAGRVHSALSHSLRGGREDGTAFRTAFAGTAADGKVRAKTGTLRASVVCQVTSRGREPAPGFQRSDERFLLPRGYGRGTCKTRWRRRWRGTWRRSGGRTGESWIVDRGTWIARDRPGDPRSTYHDPRPRETPVVPGGKDISSALSNCCPRKGGETAMRTPVLKFGG